MVGINEKGMCKKLDERRSNCGSTTRKSIVSKLIMETEYSFLHDTNNFVIALFAVLIQAGGTPKLHDVPSCSQY